MSQVPMINLQAEYAALQEAIQPRLQQVFSSTAFIQGPAVHEFEKDIAQYLGCAHAIGCGNGTDALQLALMAVGAKAGDEVIVPAFTYVATAEVIALLGLKAVWVDVDPQLFTLDVEAVAQAITPQTKVILPVHLFGQAAPMEELKAVVQREWEFSGQRIAIVEDNAQAIGAVYAYSDGSKGFTGTLGDVGCVSFYPTKNLGAYGDGGLLLTQNDEHAALLRALANHGQYRRYYHDHIGVNSRLDSIQAAILSAKLPHLDAWTLRRQLMAARYDAAFAALPGVHIPARASYSTHVFHQYTLRIADGRRDALQQHLQQQGVSSVVFYPVPLHLQTAYQSAEYPEGSFPIAEELCTQVLSLPIHPYLSDEQVQLVIDAVIGGLAA